MSGFRGPLRSGARNCTLGRVERGRQLPLLSPLQGRSPGPMHSHGTWSPGDTLKPFLSTAQLIADCHTVPFCRGNTNEGDWRAFMPLLTSINNAFSMFNSLFHPDSRPYVSLKQETWSCLYSHIHTTYHKLFTAFCLKMPGKCLQYFKKDTSIEKKLKFYSYILKCLAHYSEGKSQFSGSFPKDKCVFILDHSM